MKILLASISAIFMLMSCSKNPNGSGGTTTTVIPLAPSNLSGTLATFSQVNLTWTDNSTNEQGFKIDRKIGTGNWTTIASVNADVINYSDNGLTANTIYTYRLYSYNAVGNSINYSNDFTINTNGSNTIGGTVTICNQVWMTKNLDVSTYRNGDIIPQVTDSAQWANLTSGAWCYYNNDPAMGAIYGKLYNMYAMEDPRGLAPAGWHIPSNSEWKKLIKCVDPGADTSSFAPWYYQSSIGGGALKERGTSYWVSPNTGATNSSGFTALPGGTRTKIGIFEGIGYYGNWWGATGATDTWYNTLSYNSRVAYNGDYGNEREAFSVRCVKD